MINHFQSHPSLFVKSWKRAKSIGVILLLLSTTVASAQVVSPNGKVQWVENGSGFSIEYLSEGSKTEVLSIPTIGLLTKDGGGKELTLKGKSETKRISDRYQMICGKRHECANEANEMSYVYTDRLDRRLTLTVRAYNDGVAFRYALENLQNTRVTEEKTIYTIPEGTKRWMQKWTEPYEEFFPLSTTGV